MSDSIILDKIKDVLIKNNLSSSSRLFYVYLLLNVNSDNLYIFNDTAYICYLFGCSTRVLYNWVKELSIYHLIKFDRQLIYVY